MAKSIIIATVSILKDCFDYIDLVRNKSSFGGLACYVAI